jgi:hypothetical protein
MQKIRLEIICCFSSNTSGNSNRLVGGSSIAQPELVIVVTDIDAHTREKHKEYTKTT